MKNIFKLALLPALALPLMFTSCDEDRDSNPTLDLSYVADGFTLNVPAYAANNTYDLNNSESVTLTCSQPNYGGVNYAMRYYVQVSIDEAFANGDESVDYTELSTFYSYEEMSVDASELNNAIVELYQNANPDESSVPVMPVYIRLRAVIAALEDLYDENPSETYSNVITLPSVKAEYEAPDAEFPDYLYICGSSIQEAWSSWKEMAPAYGVDGVYYTMIYAGAGDSFKWGTYEEEWRGYDRFESINDEAGADISESDDGNSNVVIANAGWYVLCIEGTMSSDGKSISYVLNVYEGAAYVIGELVGDTDDPDTNNWIDSDADWAMTAPSDASGEWVSPAFGGSGELRAYIKVGSYDWWRTEFTLYNGELYWRLIDIPSSWSESAGSEYSVTVSAGQKLYVDFDANTGYVQ